MKRSKKWAVVRAEAPVMPWDVDGSMEWRLADAFRRVAAVRGNAYVLHFYLDAREIGGRLDQVQGEGAPLSHDESEAIIHPFYAELEELHGHDYAQGFARLWVMLSGYLERVEKGCIARTAMRRQLRRVARQ